MVEITSLGKGGVGIGTLTDGRVVEVPFGPPGSHLFVAPTQTKKQRWQARRIEMLQPPPAACVPPCPVFQLCGGCTLQELPLSVQRAYKHEYALQCVAQPLGWSIQELKERVRIHSIRGDEKAYHYRNKVEWTWGNRRMLRQDEFEAGVSFHGRFLGFHAPGHFDRIADTPHCSLVSNAANALFQTLRRETLHEHALPVWDVREHQGFWRHAMLREAWATGQIMVVLYTAPAQTHDEEQEVTRVVQALQATPLPNDRSLVGVLWMENDSIADVAQGTVRKIWGQDRLEEHLGNKRYELSAPSFFQTSTQGANILYETIRESLTGKQGILYDLYCGTGSIGIYLGEMFQRVIGIEEVSEAIEDARRNAARNGLEHAEYLVGSVEHALDRWADMGENAAMVVDPPRVGLHPRVTQALATAHFDPLIYVACHPASLGRDHVILREGGWYMTDLWAVDLFPQTGHIELVARLCKNT